MEDELTASHGGESELSCGDCAECNVLEDQGWVHKTTKPLLVFSVKVRFFGDRMDYEKQQVHTPARERLCFWGGGCFVFFTSYNIFALSWTRRVESYCMFCQINKWHNETSILMLLWMSKLQTKMYREIRSFLACPTFSTSIVSKRFFPCADLVACLCFRHRQS